MTYYSLSHTGSQKLIKLFNCQIALFSLLICLITHIQCICV